MPMMTSRILKSVGFTKTQTSRYLGKISREGISRRYLEKVSRECIKRRYQEKVSREGIKKRYQEKVSREDIKRRYLGILFFLQIEKFIN